MNGNYHDSYDYEKKDVSPVATGLLGAVAGAAIGIAVANILSDPQKRKKVGKQIQDIQKWGNKTLQDLREKSLEAGTAAADQAGNVSDKAEKIQKEIDEATSRAQQKMK